MAHLKDLIVNGASRFIGKAYGAFVGSFSGNLDGNATTSTTANTAKVCSGNAATASKLASPRTISLTGKAAGSTSFDGSGNASINVKSVNADTASKLSTARKINITGNATGAANFDGTGDISINTTVNESKHAVNADTAAHANDVTDAVIKYDVSRTDEKFTAAASGVIGHLKNLTGSTDLTSMNKLRSYIGSVFNETNWFDVLSIRHRNGAADGQNFGLLMYSNLTNTDSIKYKKQPNSYGWTEERTLLDSSNYNNYAPTKTGVGASGTWPISVSGNAASATNANTAAACSGNSATATKLATPRTISLTGNASGSANFDGSGNVSINTTVSNSAAANKVNNSGNKTAIKDGTYEPNGLYLYQCYNNGYPTAYGNVISIGGAGGGELLAGWSGANKGIEHLYYRNRRDAGALWSDWRTVAFTSDINSYAPTKTGTGASGTWGINITGNAATATTADNATTAGNVSGKIYYSADSPSVATDKLFTIKQAKAGDDNVPNNGLVIQSGPTGAAYNGKLYITDNGGDGVWIGGVASGKEVGWTRLVENKGSWNINSATATTALNIPTSDVGGNIWIA